MRWSPIAVLASLVAVGACEAAVSQPPPGSGGAASGGSSAGGGEVGGFGSGGAAGGDPCQCLPGPHNDRIYVISDEAEIWSYDPVLGDLAYVRSLLCNGVDNPYSMAIDHRGHAWVMSADTRLVFTFDLSESQGCDVASYTPNQASFDLFGMAFVRDDAAGSCPGLYIHSYSGQGPFSEGAGVGSLGKIDTVSGQLSLLSTIDYDGGELAGTGDGRLFAFAGVGPAKLLEYDPLDGQVLSTTPLTGFSKTNASAFAFYAGAFYLFTEALPSSCTDCLQASCGSEYQACLADPVCADHLACALSLGDINDDCGGLMPTAMQNCVVSCSTCLLPSSVKTSQITKYDPVGQTLEVVMPTMPIRVVGAGESVCVPPVPN